MSFEIIGEKEKKVAFEKIFNFEREDYEQAKRLPEMGGTAKKVIIHTGSGWKVKHWDNSKWAELLNKIHSFGNYKFIFIGTTEEEKAFKEIESKIKFKIYSLTNKVNLKELMIVLRRSDYFIGVDSGPRNMAHLAGLPSISLLGPGPKYFMPFDKRDIVIDKSDCRCNNLFCYKRKSCVSNITVDDVFKGFKKLAKNR